MASAGDLARQRIDEIKFRNQGGNMEGIPGFNFEYNDIDPDELKKQAPPPCVAAGAITRPLGPLPFLPSSLNPPEHRSFIVRRPKPKPKEFGGMQRARRASDGAVLSMPYKVVLKPRKPGPRPPALHGRKHDNR
jgi:hypothetical protein